VIIKQRKNKKSIAFVCPWFGPDIPGGAERATRELAINCAKRGLKTVVLTTCARDFYNWSDYHESGITDWKGISIHRFPCNARDVGLFDGVNSLLLQNKPISSFEERAFLKNIISSDALTCFIWKNRKQYNYIFTPYMFGTTYWPLTLTAAESYLVPCLHDESYIYLPRFQRMFSSVKKLLFYSEGEKELAESKLRRNASDTVIGLGMEIQKPPTQEAIDEFKIEYALEGPYIFLPGQKQPEKNTQLAIDYFTDYCNHNDVKLKLVLAGPGEAIIPENMIDSIIDLGFIRSAELPLAYSGAKAVLIPSQRESFSFTMFESWQYNTPVIVHDNCMVTALPVKKYSGGFTFSDTVTFCKVLQNILTMPHEDIIEMGKRGNELIQNEYSWDKVIERLAQAIRD